MQHIIVILGAWVTLNIGWLTLKGIIVIAYATHVHRRASRVAQVLLEDGRHQEARRFVRQHHWRISVPLLWLAPAPYVTIPAYEHVFRRRRIECLALLPPTSLHRPA